MNPITIFMIVGLLIYSCIICSEGLSKFKKNKDTAALYTASRGVGPLAMVCTMAMSMYSGLTYNGFPATAYNVGIEYISPVGASVGQCIIPVVVGYRLWVHGRKYGFTSPSEYFEARYQSKAFGYFVAALLCIFIIPYVAMQLVAVGDTVNVTTGVPYVVAVGVATVVIAFHCITGGMKSVAWMDTFHFFLAYGALALVVIFLILGFDGGLPAMAEKVMSDPETADALRWDTVNYGPKYALAQAATGSWVVIAWPHIFIRSFMNKSKLNFKVMAYTIPITMLIAFPALVLIGALMGNAYLGAGFEQTDQIMPYLVSTYCPPIVAFISMLCLCAFAVSTTDSFFLAAAQFGAKDIYMRAKKSAGKTVSEERGVLVGRIFMVILMIITLFVVWLRPAAITEMAYSLASPFFAMILPALIFGLYWRRATKAGAWAGTLGGVIVTTLFTFFVTPPLGLSALLWGLIVNFALFFVVSLCTKAPEGAAKKFVDDIDNVVLYGHGFDEVVAGAIQK